MNRTFDFNATRASCYSRNDAGAIVQQNCDYVWDFETDGTADGWTDRESKTYNAVGTYTATLTVTMVDDASTPVNEASFSDTQSQTVEAINVIPDADTSTGFAVEDSDSAPSTGQIQSTVGDTVTLKAALGADVKVVYVFWGDRRRSEITDQATIDAFTSTGVNHNYAHPGVYTVRVYTLNDLHVRSAFLTPMPSVQVLAP